MPPRIISIEEGERSHEQERQYMLQQISNRRQQIRQSQGSSTLGPLPQQRHSNLRQSSDADSRPTPPELPQAIRRSTNLQPDNQIRSSQTQTIKKSLNHLRQASKASQEIVEQTRKYQDDMAGENVDLVSQIEDRRAQRSQQ